MSIFSIFKKEEQNVKRPLRDKHGRAYYLKGVPWYKRNPRTFVAVGSFVSLSILFSKPIYDIFFLDPKDVDPYASWWPHEKARGVRNIDILRHRKMEAGPDASLLDLLKGPYKEGEIEIPQFERSSD